MKKILIALLSVSLLLSGCTAGKKEEVYEENPEVQAAFEQFLQDEFVYYLSQNKLNAHFAVEDLSAYGLEDMEVSLGDVQEQFDYTVLRTALEKLQGIDRKGLNAKQRNLYDRYEDFLQLNLQYEGTDDWSFLFTPNSGLNNNLVTMFTEFEIRSEEDIQDIINYASQVREYFKAAIEVTKNQYAGGFFQNDAVIEDILDSLERFISKKGKNNEIYAVLSKSIDSFEGLDTNKKEDYKAQLLKEVNQSVIPAYEDAIAFYNSVKGTATHNGAFYKWDGAKKYYEILIQDKCSTTLSLEEISSQLEEGINSLMKDVSGMLSKNPELYEQLYSADYGYTDAKEILDVLNASIYDDYPEIPGVEYTVSYLDPTVVADSIAAYYLNPPMDNFQKNIIRVNPNASDLYLTLAHEGFPGHCYQNMYELNNNYTPLLYYMNFIGYTEGWAVYAEGYSHKYSKLGNDKLGELLMMDSVLSYLLVGYIDLQVNYFGWSEEELDEFCSGWGFDSAMIEGLVIGDPGLYLPYGYGWLRMYNNRKKAEDALGKKFVAKEFNQVILDCGFSMFEYVDEQVDLYISSKK